MGEDPDGPWYTITERCDYCVYRWVEVVSNTVMQELKVSGPICPKCGLRNEPRDYTETDERIVPALSA